MQTEVMAILAFGVIALSAIAIGISGIFIEMKNMRTIVQQREEFIQKETERKRRYYETRNSEFTPRRGL